MSPLSTCVPKRISSGFYLLWIGGSSLKEATALGVRVSGSGAKVNSATPQGENAAPVLMLGDSVSRNSFVKNTFFDCVDQNVDEAAPKRSRSDPGPCTLSGEADTKFFKDGSSAGTNEVDHKLMCQTDLQKIMRISTKSSTSSELIPVRCQPVM